MFGQKKRVHQLVLLAVFWFDVQKKGSSGKQDGARYRQIQTHTDKHTRTEQQQKLKLKKEKKNSEEWWTRLGAYQQFVCLVCVFG